MTRDPAPPVLLTLDEVAAILRCSRRSVERLTHAGRLRTVKPTPGRTMVTVREVNAYLAHIAGRAA